MAPVEPMDNKCNDSGITAGSYTIKIPITSEGLLIILGPPDTCYKSLLSAYSCTFRGFRRFSNGSLGEVEKQQLIHEIGDWIVEIEGHSTENLQLLEVKELLKSLIDKKKKIANDLKVTFTSVSVIKQYCKRLINLGTNQQTLDEAQDKRPKYSEEKKEEIRAKDRAYKQLKRSMMSPEEKDNERAKARHYQRIRRMNQNEEEKDKEKAKSRMKIKERRMNQTEEEKDKEKAKSRMKIKERRMNQTEEEKEEDRAKSKSNIKQRRMNQTEEEKDEERRKLREFQHKIRVHQRICESSSQWAVDHNVLIDSTFVSESIQHFNLTDDINVENSSRLCLEKLQRTLIRPCEAGYMKDYVLHQSLVCVVCDQFIIGTQEFYWIKAEILKYHSNILSASYFYKEGINQLLKLQYSIHHPLLTELLLSPRARRDIEQDAFMCCQVCYNVLSECKLKRQPPKFSISNGFAIGYLPEDISRGVTPIVNNLVAPVRAFNFYVSFSGGKEQRITGNFTFFSQDVPENIGALQHTRRSNNNPNVFIILSGSFTPPQLDKIRKQGCYSCETFEKIYCFLHANNKHYFDLPSINNIPRPVVEEIHTNEDEDKENQKSGEQFQDNEPICWKYWFPNIEDPDRVNGSFRSQSEFAKALWIGETPTLIYHPSKMVNMATLSELCPIAFPFGVGDVNEKRKPFVSEVECLQHYLKISLPQFQEGQVILIIHHMYQRRKSFLSGITKCNISNNGITIADQLSEITASELDEVITQMKKTQQQSRDHTDLNTTNNISQFLRCVRTSCTPIGYTNEAASDARMKMFSLWMTFGPPSLLFTFSPCDECSFKMHLFATGKQVSLPDIKDCFQVMSSNLTLRKSLRVQYPGACARQFDDLLQIVISDLLGWQNGKQEKDLGIFGKILAFAAGVEEQGRTSLHGHIVLWVYKYHALQMRLFSEDHNVRESAMNEIKKYLMEVMSSKFIFDDEDNIVAKLLHVPNDGLKEECKGQINHVSLQNLREMRHIQYRKVHQGKVVQCDTCNKSWDTVEVINRVIEHLYRKTLHEYPGFWQEEISFPLKEEEIELIALRYQYDMIHIPPNATYLRQLLQLVVMIFFNTHDWKHRKSCYKKGNECRFFLPQVPNNEINVRFNAGNIEDIISGKPSDTAAKWYFHDGNFVNVCSFDIQTERRPWDVFVNTHNQHVSNIFGYNNNISMGSINTLYYCTLYASKSNQEEETYPYLRACEAVTSRIRKISESGSENGLSSRQIGLRRLLSGINAHLSSHVVSATMAWYLVTYGSRFHYSHEFKPLLLSQLEAWFEGTVYSRRIRYKKRQKKSENEQGNLTRSPVQFGEQSSEVWFDSDVCSYLSRPEHSIFNNMSVWEFHAKYDLRAVRPKCYMEEDQDFDDHEKYFRFRRDHPGYLYSCLVKRDHECIPKLYYSSKLPDISSLQIFVTSDVDDAVKEVRECYAMKAMLLFFPFRKKQDLFGNHDSVWNAFQEEKQKLLHGIVHDTEVPHLYFHSVQILQNIQDLLNVKKVPSNEDILFSCTDINDCDCVHATSGNEKEMAFNSEQSDEPHIDLLAQYVNEMTQEFSTFNSSLCEKQRIILSKLKTGVISIQCTQFSSNLTTHQMEVQSNEEQYPISISDRLVEPRTIITVIARALDASDIQFPVLSSNETVVTLSDEPIDISSLDAFASKNNLDMKQSIAFDAICSSFMLSFLNESNFNNISHEEKEQYRTLLQQKGAKDQLLMCVSGPGGSGKSHVIKCCRMYCKGFCDALGKPFDFSVFPLTATSNSAASLLQGKTIHLAAMLRKSIIGIELSTEVDWTVTKVLIIDEISMAGIDLFPKLDKHLRILTGNRHLLYGGIHIIFTGDFMQLAPVGGAPIFSQFNDIHWHGSLNAAIFLDQGNHRFSKDPEWGEILKRVQLGVPTSNDLARINERLISTSNKLPENIDCVETRLVYGCYTNKRRNTIMDACFLNYVMCNNPITNSNIEPSDTTILIKGLLCKDGNNVGPDFHKIMWSMCGDDNVDARNNIKIDPCLKLIKGCSLMINSNAEKEKNLVKGTLGNFVGVKWKAGCSAHIEDYMGYKVFAANVTDLDCLIMMLENDKRVVELKPDMSTVDITMPVCSRKSTLKGFKICQFAVNLSLATTGHKLQGMTKDILILSEISLLANWLYVVLSRVTTLKGLFLMVPLTMDMFQPIPPPLQRELDFLKELEKIFMTNITRMNLN